MKNVDFSRLGGISLPVYAQNFTPSLYIFFRESYIYRRRGVKKFGEKRN
nr:MAG TPA: hypothetical protein [Caudoviricetes sp.]